MTLSEGGGLFQKKDFCPFVTLFQKVARKLAGFQRKKPGNIAFCVIVWQKDWILCPTKFEFKELPPASSVLASTSYGSTALLHTNASCKEVPGWFVVIDDD